MNSEESIYISLQEATQHCNYSQEYLSLRARQGKLKAIKFGRNWVTKKEWLEEYLGNTEEYKNNLNAKKIIAPPENLPVEPVVGNVKHCQPALRFGFVVVLVFVSLITGIFHGRESFKITYETVTPFVVGLNENFEKKVEEFVFGEINYQFTTLGDQVAGIGEIATETLRGYFQWISQSYLTANDFLERGIREDIDDLVYGFKGLTFKAKQMVFAARDWTWQKWQFVIRPWKEIPIVEKEVRPRPEEGAVVVPYPEEKLAEVKGKLEKAFSDKVEVKPDETGRAGIIKPLIKEAEAQEYLYLIVPVSEQ